MKLVNFRIRSFKSIIDTGECRLSETDGVVVLAGQNEAGKSAVVEALNFFGNGPDEHFERLHRRREEHPEVTCSFLLDEQDIDEVFTKTKNEKLKNFLQKNPILSFIRGNVEKDSFEDVYFLPEISSKLSKFFPEETIEENKNVEAQPTTVQEQADAGTQDAASVKTIDELEELLYQQTRDFIFYDSFVDLLPGVVTIAEIEKYPAVLDFEKVFNIRFAEVVKKDERAISREEMRLNREASDNLNTYWKQKLEEGGKYNFTVKIVPQVPIETASKIEFKIDRDDGDPLYMEQKSKGFRWFSAFNLRLRALGVEEATIKKLVILIDEPGQGLHEKAQRDVKGVLEELAHQGAQIIYTTHYPNLIGTEGKEFARIRLVSNTKIVGTKIETVSQFAARADKGAKDSLSPLITAMGIHSIQSVLDTRRLNVVVEGISDHYYFSALKKLLGKDERLYFLPACGVNNIPNLVSVLIGWGCNYKAVFDDDPQSGRRAYNLLKNEFYEKDDVLAHEHILKIPDCNGIEDIFDPKDFYKFILNESFPRAGTKENSKLAEGKKELLARLFLEKIDNGEVTLNKESVKKITEVFDWLYQKFGVSI
ncbi:MAG: ATP-binding protein [Elusimicrobia bacterium]|nr:ATP-binding protein [Elusimicrobiota bacterium]